MANFFNDIPVLSCYKKVKSHLLHDRLGPGKSICST